MRSSHVKGRSFQKFLSCPQFDIMLQLCLALLIPLAVPSCGFQASFMPSKLNLSAKISQPLTSALKRNATKPALKYDFSSLAFGHNAAKMTSAVTDPSLQKKIEEATEPLEQTIQNLTARNIQLKSQLSSLKELNSQKASQKQRCSTAMKQVKSMAAELSKAKAEVKSLTTELSTTEEELKTKRREKLELKTKFDKAVEHLEEANKSREDGKPQTSRLKNHMPEKMLNLTKRLSKAEMKVKTLQREKLEMKTKLDKLTEQLEAKTKPNGPVLVVGCPEEFTHNKKANICYGIIKEYGSYDRATTYCKKNYGGRLAVLNSSRKFNAVRSALRKERLRVSFWVGSHADDKGKMFWTDGSKISNKMWAPGEPNNRDEKCSDMHKNLSFKLNDELCESGNFFVCEVVL